MLSGFAVQYVPIIQDSLKIKYIFYYWTVQCHVIGQNSLILGQINQRVSVMFSKVQKYEKDISTPLSAGEHQVVLSPPQIKGYI